VISTSAQFTFGRVRELAGLEHYRRVQRRHGQVSVMANPLVVMCSSAQDTGCAFAATPMMSVTMSTVVISGQYHAQAQHEERFAFMLGLNDGLMSVARLPRRLHQHHGHP
jgi:hypothetical protein